MDIKTGIRKGFDEDSLQPYFTIGNQTFHLQEIIEDTEEETKEVAEWTVKMLKKAFDILHESVVRLPISDIKKEFNEKFLPNNRHYNFEYYYDIHKNRVKLDTEDLRKLRRN